MNISKWVNGLYLLAFFIVFGIITFAADCQLDSDYSGVPIDIDGWQYSKYTVIGAAEAASVVGTAIDPVQIVSEDIISRELVDGQLEVVIVKTQIDYRCILYDEYGNTIYDRKPVKEVYRPDTGKIILWQTQEGKIVPEQYVSEAIKW